MMQTNNRLHHTESSYYLLSALKLTVLAFVILTAFSSQAQSQVFLECDALTESPFDEVRIIKTIGKPSDTVWVPLFLIND